MGKEKLILTVPDMKPTLKQKVLMTILVFYFSILLTNLNDSFISSEQRVGTPALIIMHHHLYSSTASQLHTAPTKCVE